jgi:Zn finger protein HypA/HybF involved in hydrogenase expression
MAKKFQKKVENFVCEHCSKEVVGRGYKNHCPVCIWSKHVDINPGDREATCGGMMKPVKLESEEGEFIMTHRCTVCFHEKRNKLSKEDDFDVALLAVKPKI